MYEGRSTAELPFLPAKLPDRPLTLADLDWRPCLRLPEPPLSAFTPTRDLDRLQKLDRSPGLA